MVSSPSFISVDEIQWPPAKDEIAEKKMITLTTFSPYALPRVLIATNKMIIGKERFQL
jgi:hypothetical protein